MRRRGRRDGCPQSVHLTPGVHSARCLTRRSLSCRKAFRTMCGRHRAVQLTLGGVETFGLLVPQGARHHALRGGRRHGTRLRRSPDGGAAGRARARAALPVHTSPWPGPARHTGLPSRALPLGARSRPGGHVRAPGRRAGEERHPGVGGGAHRDRPAGRWPNGADRPACARRTSVFGVVELRGSPRPGLPIHAPAPLDGPDRRQLRSARLGRSRSKNMSIQRWNPARDFARGCRTR